MSLKSEIKMGVLHDQGVKADDRLEAAQRRQVGHDGAKQALRQIAKNISSLAVAVDNDLKDNKLPLEEPTKVAAYVKLMVDRAANMAMTAAQHQENLQLAAGGEIAAHAAMVEGLRKELEAEKAKLMALKEAIESGRAVIEDDGISQSETDDLAGRPVGVRPGASIAAQRKAQDAMEASEGVPATSSDESPTDGSDKKKREKRKGN